MEILGSENCEMFPVYFRSIDYACHKLHMRVDSFLRDMNNYISILGMTQPATCTCSCSRMVTGSSSGKRMRVVLSIDDKVGIIASTMEVGR